METGAVIPLWPEGVPGLRADAPPDRADAGHVYSVNHPSLTYYPAPAGTACGAAVIVCPGGGYVDLAVAKEGDGAARWLNSIGVAAFVLEYRLGPAYHYPAQLRDVLRAVRLVRARAAEWGVDPGRIGVAGFSAGGHLAACAGTLYESADGRTGAALDAVSARPDFLILVYPVITMRDPYAHKGSRYYLLGAQPTPAEEVAVSPELHVTKNTPPAFLVATETDKTVPEENSIMFYEALRAAGVPAELHLYEKGPHGFGFNPGYGPASEWPQRAADWMRWHGWLTAAPQAAVKK